MLNIFFNVYTKLYLVVRLPRHGDGASVTVLRVSHQGCVRARRLLCLTTSWGDDFTSLAQNRALLGDETKATSYSMINCILEIVVNGVNPS